MEKNLRIICIYNPFDPSSSKEEKVVEVKDECSVEEYAVKLFPELFVNPDLCACLNGVYIGKDAIIRTGGILTITTVPRGDSQTLRLVAASVIMVAAVVTGQLYGAGFASTVLGLGSSNMAVLAGQAILTTAISTGGMLALNAVMPMETPKNNYKKGSRTYSFSGASNYAVDGDVLPDLIGTVRFAPPLIGAYRSLDGDTSSTQYINLLFALADISDGVSITLADRLPGSVIQSKKIFINNTEQALVTVNSTIINNSFDPSKKLEDYENDNYASINMWFSNMIHEVDVGKQIPLDRYLDSSNTMKSVQVQEPTHVHKGFQYRTFNSGSGVSSVAPTTVYTTQESNVSEIGVKFSFLNNKNVIDRVDVIDLSYEYKYDTENGFEYKTVTETLDIQKIAWQCAFKYKKPADTYWQSTRFSIFSPQWNGTNEIDGGLWFERSGLSHPDEDGTESSESPSASGDQFSFSVKLPSLDKWEYGIDCYGYQIYNSRYNTVDAGYSGGDVTSANPDFCILDAYTESTPDALETFDIDGDFDINDITVVLSFPAGVICYNKEGKSGSLKVEICLGIRKGDNGNWIERIVEVDRATTTPFRHAVHFDTSLFANSGSDSNHYYVRAYYMKDYTSNRYVATCVIDYLQLSKFEPMIYPGVATMAMRIKATSKISGRAPVVEVIAKRNDYPIKYNNDLLFKRSSNPSWACVYRLQKFGVKEDHINFTAFENWANFCDSNNFQCNFYIDTEMSLDETLSFIARCGRGAIIRRGVYYDVLIDKINPPVQMFTDGNIVSGSFSQNFIADEDLSNCVCVWYSDINAQSGESTKKAIEVRANSIAADEEIKRIEVEFLGCTNKDDAKKYAVHLLNQTIATRRTVSFVAAIDAVTCEVGDVIMVSMNNTMWTLASGRTTIVRDSYFEIDTPIVHDVDYSQYRIRVRKNSNESNQEDGFIELQVNPAFPTNINDSFVRFNTALGLNPSNFEEIENNIFVYSLGAIRASDSKYLDAKKFRVISIERESQMLFRITASEYFDDMYNDEYVINEIITPTIQRNYVSNLKGVANFSYDGKPYITLTWTGKAPVFYVFYKSEGAWIKYSEAIDTICNVRGVNFTPNEQYSFSVSATDNPYVGQVCTVVIPEDHIPLKPGEKEDLSYDDYLAITGLEIVGQGNDTIWKERDLKIRWNEIVYDFDSKIDKPVEGASTSNSDMKELRKFRIVLKDRCGTIIKEDIVYEPHYELIFDDNKRLFAERTIDPYTGCIASSQTPVGPPELS